jgi:hypothetical protein
LFCSGLATSAADPVDFVEMAAEQNCCPETQRLLGGTSLKCGDDSTGNFRPIVPLKFRKTIFNHFHNVAHPGRLVSPQIISSRFVWRGLFSNVTAWARRCLACQWGTIHRHTRLAPQPIPIPQWLFSRLHVDLARSPGQHGPRSYPLYSSDSEHNRGKTLVFPRLRQFSVPKLCCQMNFCKMMSFQLILILLKFSQNLACSGLFFA